MSAISALFDRTGATIGRDPIERMVRAQSPFGGDGERSATYGEAALGIAMRWTTPEDVGASQPVQGGEGRFAMVFDGRIDNREELAEALRINDGDLRQLSDARLMMCCYEQWGEDGFVRVVGDYAFALWDSGARELKLVTDPMGVRGMVYYITPERAYVATMPRGLHALPEVPRELDEEKIADALCQLMVGSDKTAFKDLRFVLPARIVTISPERVHVRRYFRMSDHVKPVQYPNDEDYVEAARELFAKAVNARLRTHCKIGALMSGGLDSSTVAVTVSGILEKQGKRLPTFTSVPQDDWDGKTEPHCYGDETPYVKAIAEQYPNIELNLVKAAGRGHYYRQDEYLRLAELPMRNAALLGWMNTIFEDVKSRGIKVMFVGDSGNMTLSYHGRGIYFEMFKRGQWLTLFRELRALDPRWAITARHFNSKVLAGFFSNEGWDRLMRLRGREDIFKRWIRHSTARSSFGREMRIPERARESHFDYFGRSTEAGRALWRNMMDEPLGPMYPYMKALNAMHGIETRDPLGDRRLVEWCLGVPEDQFHRDGSPRWLIKRMMDGILPDEVLYKKLQIGRINSDWQVRLASDLDRMRADLAAMRDDPDLSRMVDIERLEGWIDNWPQETVTSNRDDRRFQLAINLPFALNAARFVELVKGRNR